MCCSLSFNCTPSFCGNASPVTAHTDPLGTPFCCSTYLALCTCMMNGDVISATRAHNFARCSVNTDKVLYVVGLHGTWVI